MKVIIPDRDAYYLGICREIARRAKCTRRQVGALIVKDDRIVATGRNGAPAGHYECTEGACPRGRKTLAELPSGGTYDTQDELYCIAVHAEANVIIYGDYDRMRRGIMYITDEPCRGCLKLIMGAGILRVVTPAGGFDIPQHGFDKPPNLM